MSINLIVSLLLFFISCLGVFLSQKNLILSLMSLELALLSININFIYFSFYTDSLIGQLMTFFILVIGASESALGLAFLILYYKGYKYYY